MFFESAPIILVSQCMNYSFVQTAAAREIFFNFGLVQSKLHNILGTEKNRLTYIFVEIFGQK